MRSLWVTFIAFLAVSAPFAAALMPSAVDREDASAQDILRFFRPDAVAPPPTSAPASWSAAVLALYAAANVEATPEMLRALTAQDAALDPRLQAWVAPLVQATADAATLSLAGARAEAALVLLDAVDRARAPAAHSTSEYPDCLKTASVDPAAPDPLAQARTAVDFTIRTSVSTIDECDSPHRDPLPVPVEAWPPVAVSDPAGLIILGTVANDVYTTDAWLQIEPAGDDLWANNAGGARIRESRDGTLFTVDPEVRPVALAWDMRGNDRYDVPNYPQGEAAQGAGIHAVGILLEDEGDDIYRCRVVCQGSAELQGIGVLHDQAGNDVHELLFGRGLAFSASQSVAIVLEDGGDDCYQGGAGGLGLGLLADAYIRDADGLDEYWAKTTNGVHGRSYEGRAYFRDFGADADFYEYVGANDARWSIWLGPGRLPPEWTVADGWDR